MEWIKCSDKMPTVLPVDDDYSCSGKLLCIVGGDYLILRYQTSDKEGGWEVWYCDEYEDVVENVTHWMPLPEPPKE